MKKENVVELTTYRKEVELTPLSPPSPLSISDELTHAIEHLIHRLRELGPLKRECL